MNIFVGSDHGGFELKEKMVEWLRGQQYEVEDCGAAVIDTDDDYPDFAFVVAEKVAPADSEAARGILFCRSGAGMVIAANKVKGIRAATADNAQEAQHDRNDNDANILGISADWHSEDEVKEIILAFLNTPFSQAPRHIRRIQKISKYEEEKLCK